MVTKYSEEFKSSIISKLLPPHNISIPDMVKETGIPKDTLYTWKRKYRNVRGDAGTNDIQQPNQLSNEEKLAVVIETASLSEVELGEYCRRKGFFPDRITGWKKALTRESSSSLTKAERAQLKELATTIKQLEKELHRKEKALAEAAALLVLQKKFQALWEELEVEKPTSRRAKK